MLSKTHASAMLGQARLSRSGGWPGGSEKLRIRLNLSAAGAWALLSLAKKVTDKQAIKVTSSLLELLVTVRNKTLSLKKDVSFTEY